MHTWTRLITLTCADSQRLEQVKRQSLVRPGEKRNFGDLEISAEPHPEPVTYYDMSVDAVRPVTQEWVNSALTISIAYCKMRNAAENAARMECLDPLIALKDLLETLDNINKECLAALRATNLKEPASNG